MELTINQHKHEDNVCTNHDQCLISKNCVNYFPQSMIYYNNTDGFIEK